MPRQSRRATAGGHEPGHLRHGGDDIRCGQPAELFRRLAPTSNRRMRQARAAGDRSAPPVRCQSHLLPAGTGKVVFMRLKQLVIAATPLARPAHCWADRCRVAAAAREMAADGWYQS